MKKYTVFLLLTLVPSYPLQGAEDSRITKIRNHYNKVTADIKSRNLQMREIYITHTVIPGIGTPVSRVKIYYNMVHIKGAKYRDTLIKIENFYQYAGNITYEEFLYKPGGELQFYYTGLGFGSIKDLPDTKWKYEERFYFHKGKTIRVIYNKKAANTLSGPDIKKGQKRLKHAAMIRQQVKTTKFPVPLVSSRLFKP